MKKRYHQDRKAKRQVTFGIIALYAVITILPACVYAFSLNQKDPDTESKMVSSELGQTVTASAVVPDSPPQSAPESEEAPTVESSEIPATPDFLEGLAPTALIPKSSSQTPEPNSAETSNSPLEASVFRIYDQHLQKVLTVSDAEFLPAAIACEMPLTVPKEALKAQAVATYTYYSRARAVASKESSFDFECNTEEWLIYVPKENLKTRWGEQFGEYYQLLTEICDAVRGQLLCQEGQPINSTYFSISAGSTEASAQVWGGELTYLTQVASPGDVFSDRYMSEMKFTPEKLQALTRSHFESKADESGKIMAFDFSIPHENWFQNEKRSSAGYVNTVNFCGIDVLGTELRSALSLASTCFDVDFQNNSFTFTVRGLGHGVGMSQSGAIFMAQQGSDYGAILAHYYTGANLLKFDS